MNRVTRPPRKKLHQLSTFPPLPNLDGLDAEREELYVPTQYKMLLCLLFATVWCLFSVYIALPWIDELSLSIGSILAWLVISGIALIPGFANAFLMTGLLLDRRPDFDLPMKLPAISILIAAYNEAECIEQTLESIKKQVYAAPVQVIIIDDGSKDNTVAISRDYIAREMTPRFSAEVLVQEKNAGKAVALNAGLQHVLHEHVITLDADSYLFKDALETL